MCVAFVYTVAQFRYHPRMVSLSELLTEINVSVCNQQAGADVLTLMQVYENTQVKKRVASAKPYGKWLAEGSQKLEPVNFSDSTLYSPASLLKHQLYVTCIFITPSSASVRNSLKHNRQSRNFWVCVLFGLFCFGLLAVMIALPTDCSKPGQSPLPFHFVNIVIELCPWQGFWLLKRGRSDDNREYGINWEGAYLLHGR